MAKNLETNNKLTEGGEGDDCVVLCAGWCAAVAAGKNKTENFYLNQEVIISLCNLVILCLYLPTFKRYCDK